MIEIERYEYIYIIFKRFVKNMTEGDEFFLPSIWY